MIGRNGIFYDRKGRDYDATISKILASPISLRQAFWSPYKKLVRLIEEQVAKRAADADADVNNTLTTVATAPAAAPTKLKFDPSVIALISVALGSLAAAFAGVLAFLGKFDPWEMPFVFGGIMLAISGPSLILAFIKLRKRNLGPILDANGWAVNAKARMNVPFGGALTGVAALPPGATFGAADEYAEKPSIWPKLLMVAFVVWFVWAFLNDSQGRLWRWTKDCDTLAPVHNIAAVPAAVQKALDEAAANNPAAKTAPNTMTNAVTGSLTNSLPAK
jgi:hypothetical protein